MAETTITQSGSGQTATFEPTTIDLETGAAISVDVTGTTETLPNDEVTQLRTENAKLQRDLERQRSQNAGAQAEARRLHDRLTTLEQTVQQGTTRAATTATTGTGDEAPLTEAELAEALTASVLHDDHTKLQPILRKLTQRPAQPTITEQDVERITTRQIVNIGTKGQLQQILTNRHEELQDPTSDFAQALWANYDTFANDPQTQLMFQPDEKTMVPMMQPDGTTKNVNAQLVDRLAIEMKSQLSRREGRRDEQRAATVGTVQGGTGRGARTTSRPVVEAVELMAEELALFQQHPELVKGWGKQLPTDLKARAKYLWDGLDETKKKQKLDAYRARQTQVRTA